jgi:hypothetical protein
MRSKPVPVRFRRPAEAQRRGNLALDAGLLIYCCIYCVIVGCAALGLYELMQPTRYPNPGVGAPMLPSRSAPVFASPVEPELKEANPGDQQEAKGEDQMAQQPNKAQDSDHATVAAGPKRTRPPARPKRRDPANGAQPVFGSYRPWSGYQAWGNSRAWR